MRLLSCRRVSCWVNWNCRDYINGINELWLPNVAASIKTAWWAKWTQADKRTGSILWAYRLLKETLLPSRSQAWVWSTETTKEHAGQKAFTQQKGCRGDLCPFQSTVSHTDSKLSCDYTWCMFLFGRFIYIYISCVLHVKNSYWPMLFSHLF